MKRVSGALRLLPQRPSAVADPAMREALQAARHAWGGVTGWSLHPDALAALPALVGDSAAPAGGLGPRGAHPPWAPRPRAPQLLIIECGSGFSTLVLHQWARRRAAPTRVLSFEHQPGQLSHLAGLLGPEAMACVQPSPLSQVTEATFRRMLSSPWEARSLWRERADPLPEDLYEQTRITRAFYDRLIEAPPEIGADERLLVILDGPNGSGRSIAFPVLASLGRQESFWLIDDWDHYPFLTEMAAVFDIQEEQTAKFGNHRWKLVRAHPARK